jgi:hypothetical protein
MGEATSPRRLAHSGALLMEVLDHVLLLHIMQSLWAR